MPTNTPPARASLILNSVSSLRRYQNITVGSGGIGTLVRYELVMFLAAPMPGALGLWLRKLLFPLIIGRVGSGVKSLRLKGIRLSPKVRMPMDIP